MSADVDLDALHDLAAEVDATRRLIAVADQLVVEILERDRQIHDRVDVLNGDGYEPPHGPTRLDRIMELSQAWAVTRDLLWLADRICRAVDGEPPSVGATYSKMMLEHLDETEALKAELEAARAGG